MDESFFNVKDLWEIWEIFDWWGEGQGFIVTPNVLFYKLPLKVIF